MLECVDRECLCMEQEEAGIPFQSQAMVRVHYKGRPILLGFIMNFHAPRLKIGIRRFIVQNPFVHPLRLLVSFVVKNAVSHPVRPITINRVVPLHPQDIHHRPQSRVPPGNPKRRPHRPRRERPPVERPVCQRDMLSARGEDERVLPHHLPAA